MNTTILQVSKADYEKLKEDLGSYIVYSEIELDRVETHLECIDVIVKIKQEGIVLSPYLTNLPHRIIVTQE